MRNIGQRNQIYVFQKDDEFYFFIIKYIKFKSSYIDNILLQSQNYILKIKIEKMEYMDVLMSYTQSSDPEEIFQLLDILGQGAYGNVTKALHKQTGELYAIKILPATSVNEISVIKKQIAILRQCNDQHIVKYYGSYFKDNNLWIVMEYCMAGSVTDIVNITQKQLNENQIASILELVLKGLRYLHQRKKIHRDIKAANILLDQNGTAKLADFGVSTEMMYTNARHNTHIGSPYWMSPEVIKYSEYNQKTDIWSLGVTAIQLAEGVVPYSHLKPFMAMWTMKDKPIQSFKQPEKWSSQFNDFIKQCLQINPQLRPNAEDLLHHDFIRKYSRGKRILAEMVQNSMADIQNFRAGQGIAEQQSFDKNDIGQLMLNKGDSNGSQYQSRTVIVKNNSKSSDGVDSVIEHSSHSKSFKKSQSIIEYDRHEDYNDEEAEYGSVIIKDDNDNNNGHSRNCSMVSVSSVIVKNDQIQKQCSTGQQQNYLQSYIQNLQCMQQKQEELKQNIEQKIVILQQNCIKVIQAEYNKVKNQIKVFVQRKSQNIKQTSYLQSSNQTLSFSSKLLTSQSLLQYLFKNQKFTQERQKLQDQYKQQYLSNIQPVQNNYISMMLESANEEGSTEYHKVMQIIDQDEDNILIEKQAKSIGEYRKKSQSSADSPTSLFNNRKKNVKKLIIQEALDQPTEEFLENNNEINDTHSVNITSNNKSTDKYSKQSSINKFIEKTPILNQNNNKNRFKQVMINSANFSGNTNNKSLMMSTTNYGNSTTISALKGQKRVITTQPHEAYQYDNDNLSTLTKLNQRNFRQFYDDPVVMNNLKQLTQQSSCEFLLGTQLNPFELKKSSFSKQIKSVKSKEKDKLFIRQKQRATHIAHIAMANNKERTITNSNKKLKVIKVMQEKQKSPEDNSESIKMKGKKSKSKNKQTASTTIPFGSVGNMGNLDFLPSKIGKSKDKKISQIPVKSGPFSKIKNRN